MEYGPDYCGEEMSLAELAFAESPIGTAIVSTLGPCVRTNRAFNELLGWSHDQLLDFQVVFHADDAGLDQALRHRLTLGTLKAYEIEKRCRHRDGGVVPVLLSASLIRQKGSACFLYHFQDITQQVLEKSQLAAANRQMESTLRHRRELAGTVLMCSCCRNVQSTGDAWQSIEQYLGGHSDLQVSHSICPACLPSMLGRPSPRSPQTHH